MSRVQSFSWDKPEFVTFPDRDVVTFEVLEGVEEFETSEEWFGIKIRTKVVDSQSGDNIGKVVPMIFPFLTKTGKQNAGTFHFLNAMFPDQIRKGEKLPFHFLEGCLFKAVSKRVPSSKDPSVRFQNWEAYKSLGRPDEGTSF